MSHFLTLVFTHTGEFSSGAFDTIEKIAMRVYEVALREPPPSGETPAQVSAAVRRDMKDAFCAAMVNGWGRVLLAASAASFSRGGG